jgi:ABC-type amino acid transport substrate-binding protein
MKQHPLLLAILACVWLYAPVQGMSLRTVSQLATPARFDANNHDAQGICVEIMRAVEDVDPDLHFVWAAQSAPLSRILTDLEQGHIDVFFCAAYTPERARVMRYIQPQLYSSQVKIAVRSSDTAEPYSLQEIANMERDSTLLVTQGSIFGSLPNNVPGLKVDRGTADKVANLKKLISGRGRFYIETELNLRRAIRDAYLEKEIRILSTSFMEEPQYIVVSNKLDPWLVNKLTSALQKLILHGELKRIYDRYSP